MSEKKLEIWRQALLATEVLKMPKHSLATFGPTNLPYYCLSEIGERQTKVRRGAVLAQKPKIILPEQFKEMFEGLSPEAREFANHMLDQYGPQLKALGYRFEHEAGPTRTYKKSLKETFRALTPKLEEENLTAVITGPEQLWQISVVKLALDMTIKSFPANTSELEERGMFDPQRRLKSQAENLFAQCESSRLPTQVLGDFLLKNRIFEDYEDRFFDLIKRKGR